MEAGIDKTTSGSLGAVLAQSWPASLTMLSGTLMRFVDGLMAARVGPGPMTAQQIAGMISFIPEAFAIGALTVVNTYVSQNLGARRLHACAQYAWAGIAIGLMVAACMAPLALLAPSLFALFPTRGASFVAMQVLYFRYMVLGAFVTLPGRTLDNFFYGIHRPRVVLGAALTANAFNVAANYVLIYGKLGFPALGLEGAAIGSVLGFGLQLVILLSVYLGPGVHRRFATRRFTGIRWAHLADILGIGWPSGVQFCNRVLAWSVFLTVLVGTFGPAHLAATAISLRYLGLSFMPAVGVGIATTALVGKLIGQDRRDRARRAARSGLAAAMIYMGTCGVVFWLFRTEMVRFFLVLPGPAAGGGGAGGELSAEIVRIGSTILILAAVFQLFDAVSIVYVGALRGAGDTRWPMVATIVLSWGLTVGGGVAMVRWMPHWGSLGPWVAASVYTCALGVALAWRFESGAWEKIDLLRRPRGEPVGAAEATPTVPELIVGQTPQERPAQPQDDPPPPGRSGQL